MFKWIGRLLMRKPPSMHLECVVGGRHRTYWIKGFAGFRLRGVASDGERLIHRQQAVNPRHWDRIWKHLTKLAKFEWGQVDHGSEVLPPADGPNLWDGIVDEMDL